MTSNRKRREVEWMQCSIQIFEFKSSNLKSQSECSAQDVSDKEKRPAVVHETDLVKLWYKQETSFEAPKAVAYLKFQSPEAYFTPENAVLTRLFVKLLSDKLNEISYEAELAGLSYHVQNTTSGFLASFAGYCPFSNPQRPRAVYHSRRYP